MSVKKKSSLNNIFTFKESEKSLKKNPLGFFSAMSEFNEPEKKQKQLKISVLGLMSTTKMLKLELDVFFYFMEV